MVVADVVLGSNMLVSVLLGSGLWRSRRRILALEQAMAGAEPPYLGAYRGPGVAPCAPLEPSLAARPHHAGGAVIVPLDRPVTAGRPAAVTASRSMLAHPSFTPYSPS